VDNAGTAKTGSVLIPYTSTTHDSIVGTASVSGTVRVAVGDSEPVALTFTTDDGNVATHFTVTSGLSNLPTYWSGPASLSCPSVSTGTGCQVSLTFAPLSSVSGTITLGYSYTDSAGTAKTGTVSVPYAVKHVYVTDSNGVYVCSIVTGGSLSNCTLTALNRTGSNGNPVTGAYGITFAGDYSYVNQYPDGSLSICQLSLSDGTLSGCSTFSYPVSGDYAYSVFASNSALYAGNSAGNYCPIEANGALGTCQGVSSGVSRYSFGIYVGAQQAYVASNSADVQGCTVAVSGDLTPCTDTGISTDVGGALTVYGNFAFLTPWSTAAVLSCSIHSDGSLGSCISSPVPGSNTGAGVSTAVFAGNSYTVNASDVEHCAVDSATGALSACAVSDGGATFSGPSATAIY
jgi:hypothetical protein